ncbi:autotransporter assembly complex family protein [Hephaestia sp. GCM10023244]|uniref:autotransporter assembly complex protein TamA n=1 Tax=unclassified Hephaestia TaxID=2631281 RepID=UPI002077662F|nr:BamA/TamA family outer membrane protein [Hephaestia sp. MAHUQ-44]MCM8729484.1 BamA/TamA family outer membrane protein [Hephaestia sp. MAHUQ-44]
MKCGSGRHGAVLGAATLLCVVLASPARAQSSGDSAAADPQTAPEAVPLNPETPLAPLPGLGVDWPDLSLAPDEVAVDTGQTSDIASETRYGFAIEGLNGAETPLLRQRFDELSTLKAHDGDPANAAQLERRAREDAELLTTLLRGEGYYDARVTTGIGRRDGRPLVTLTADPGGRYHFAEVSLDGVLAAGGKAEALRHAFGVKQGDPVDADAIAAGTTGLRTAIGREGFPFAQVDEPEIVVDHATRTATLDLSVIPGGARHFGAITTPEGSIFDGEHIQDIARFEPGDRYDAAEVEDLRRALIQTGLVSSADITPVQGSTPDTVDLAITMAPAPPRTIAGELGYGTGEGVRTEVSWTHRNMFPPEGALTLRGVLGTREQLGNIIFRRNNYHARDRVLTGQVALAHINRNAYDARTFSVSGTLERQSTIFYQKDWTWSVGAELVATDERDVILSTGAPRRRTYFIGALPGTLGYDGSDDLLNPTRGFRISGRLSPELSLSGQVFGYARTQVDASAYQPVSDSVVLAGRVRLGTILGAPRDAIAPSRRFYAGGGGSVRGYGYQDIGPRDPNNDPIGGRSLTEFSIEARVKAFGNFGIVPFLDAGNIYTSPLPKLSDLRFGTGIGVRYYSSFGPIRVDVGTPINPQKGDPRIAVYVSLGQAF